MGLTQLRKAINTYSSRKTIGDFLKNLELEYYNNEGSKKCDISEDQKTLNFDFEKDEKRLTAEIKFYQTGWKVKLDVTPGGYFLENFGKIKEVSEIFTNGKKLKSFLNDCQYKQEHDSIESEFPKEKFYNLKDSIMNICLENLSCTSHFFENGYPKEYTTLESFIRMFEVDEDVNYMLNLFNFFHELDEKMDDSIYKDLALYLIAKEFFKSKYQMLNLDIESHEIKGYEIQAKSQPFAYAHVLQFYGGKCKWLHGHNGNLVIKAVVAKETIKNRPMFLSYGFLKGFLKYMDKKLDHKTYWALNKENKYIIKGSEFTIDTPKQRIIFKDKEGHLLIPFLGDSSPYSTSEVTLYNYVLPQFLIFMVRFIIENNGPDSTNMSFCEINELINFSFSWYETETTVCTININC
jgi:6-pyruvoyl-tetrahydropterin synthase